MKTTAGRNYYVYGDVFYETRGKSKAKIDATLSLDPLNFYCFGDSPRYCSISAFWKSIPISIMTRDPIAIGDLPVYAGFLSQVGIFFWSATATLRFFGAKTLPRQMTYKSLRLFLLASGVITLFLGIDDAFLLHESVFPRFGIPKIFVLSSYAGVVLVYLITFHRVIFETDYALLVVALAGC